MNTGSLEDHEVASELTREFLVRCALAALKAIHLAAPELHTNTAAAVTTEIAWSIAGLLEGARVGHLPNGREVRSSLGLVASGSKSAFETPFLKEETVLLAGRISIHDYVHDAVDRALQHITSDPAAASEA